MLKLKKYTKFLGNVLHIVFFSAGFPCFSLFAIKVSIIAKKSQKLSVSLTAPFTARVGKIDQGILDMTQDSLTGAIAAAQQRLQTLLQRADEKGENSGELLQEAIAELSNSLEELQVVAEELEAQNEELTATREAQEADRQLYQNLFNAASDGYLLTDADGIIQQANPAAAFLLNVQQFYLLGKPLAVFVHPQQRQKFRQILTQLPQKGQIREEEVRMFHPERKIDFPAQLTGVAMRDTQGKLVSLCFLVRDISEWKQAQEKLAESENLLSAIIESEPECVKLIARDGTLLEMNPAGLAMIEVESLAQVQGKSIYRFVVSDYLPAFQALTERVFQGESGILEFEIVGLKGTRRWLETHAVPFRNAEGEIAAVLSVTRDISDRKHLELALQASQTKLKDILNRARASIVSFRVFADETWEYDYYSAGCEAIFGFTPEEMMTGIWWSRIPPEDQQSVIIGARQFIFTEQPTRIEYRFLHKDGTLRWISTDLSSRYDEANRCFRVIAIDSDISDRKRAETALLASEQQLRGIINSAGAAIVRFRVYANRNWDYEFYSAGTLQLFGYTPEEMKASKTLWLDRIHPQDLQNVIFPAYQDIFAEKTITIEFRFQRRDGEWIWVSQTLTSHRDRYLDCWLVTGIAVDISARKQAEDELEKINTAMSHAVEGISRLDTQGRYIAVNQAYANTFGYTPEEMIGISWYLTVHPDDLETAIAAYQQMLSTGKGEAEVRGICQDGSMFYKQVVMVAALDEQKQLIGHYCFMKNISDRKNAEAALHLQEQKLRMITDALPVYISYLDNSQRYQFVNKTYEIRFGLTREQICGKHIREIMGEDAYKVIQRNIEQALAGNPITYEAAQPDPQLGTRYNYVTLIPDIDEDSQVRGCYTLVIDISDRKQAEVALQKQIQQQEALNRVMQAIRNSLDLNAIFNTATTEFAQLLSAEGSYIVQYLSERKVWQIVAEYHKDPQAPNTIGFEIPDQANPIANRLKQLEVVQVSDTNTIEDEVNLEIAKIFPGSWLIIPLTVGEAVWGSLNLYKYQADSASVDSQIELARAVADQLAIAIQQANLYQQLQQELIERQQAEIQLQRQAQQKELLNRVIQGIRNSLDLKVIFQTANNQFVELLSAEESYITQYFPEEQIWRVIAGYSQNPELPDKTGLEIPDTENPVTAKLKKLEIFQVSDAKILEDEQNKELAQICPGAWLILPLIVGESLWGSLNLLHSQTNTIWYQDQIELARAVVDQLAIAIQQANLYQQLQQELTERKQTEIELQKAKEAAEAANVAKSTFLANMSHELRTPLNAILGFTQMMARDRTLSPQQQEQIKIINNAGDHLLALINDILEMSKIEAGRTSFNPTSFDLINFLSTLEELFKLKAESKGLQLNFHLAPDLPQYIQTDEGKLRQVLINIIGNAIKFTEKGQVTLRVNLLGYGQEKSNYQLPSFPDSAWERHYQLLFEIEDTGLGIKSEEIDRIFDPFIQSETGKKTMQGTGLGLAISRKFVQMLGGNIAVTSQPNKGSLFSFNIQVAPAETIEKNLTQTPRQVIGLAPNQPEYRILVVDDHPESRLLLVTLLGSIGFQVNQAANGTEAISIWATWKPHLICMDIRMPVMDGIQATQQIRAKEKELNDPSVITNSPTLIIALTANAFDSDKNLILAAGCDDYISKPLKEYLVLSKIGQSLKIAYLYQSDNQQPEENPQYPDSKLAIIELKKYLNQMPGEWIDQLHKTAYIGDDNIIFKLLAQIPPEYSELTKALADFTHNFEFDKIIELTQT